MAGALIALMASTSLKAIKIFDSPVVMQTWQTSSVSGVTLEWGLGHKPGDMLILFIQTAAQVVTAPSGFSPIGTPIGVGTAGTAKSSRLTMLYSVATSNAMANVTVADPGDHILVFAVRVRNASSSQVPLTSALQAYSTALTSCTIGDLTTVANNSRVFRVAAHGGGGVLSSPSVPSGSSGWVWHYNSWTTEGVDGGLVVGSGLYPVAGPIGAYTNPWTTAQRFVSGNFALQPVERTAAPTVQLSSLNLDESRVGGASCFVYLHPNGRFDCRGNSASPADWDWCSNPAVATEYEAQATVNSGALSFGTVNTWVPLGADAVGWSVDAGEGVSAQANITVRIRHAATGVVMTTATYEMAAFGQFAVGTF